MTLLDVLPGTSGVLAANEESTIFETGNEYNAAILFDTKLVGTGGIALDVALKGVSKLASSRESLKAESEHRLSG